jgi:hypothetical protein
MTEHEASRTLVKSPPELWAECSNSAALTRHLGEFGEIRITRLEPETTVAWEGKRASGTVRLEPSGWGTRVILTAREVRESEPPAPPGAVHDPEPAAVEDPEPAGAEDPEPEATEPAAPVQPARPRFMARLRAALRRKPSGPAPPSDAPLDVAVSDRPVEAEAESEVAVAEPEPPAVEPPATDPPATDPPSIPNPEAVLTAALDSLGQAHHRPFSRA